MLGDDDLPVRSPHLTTWGGSLAPKAVGFVRDGENRAEYARFTAAAYV